MRAMESKNRQVIQLVESSTYHRPYLWLSNAMAAGRSALGSTPYALESHWQPCRAWSEGLFTNHFLCRCGGCRKLATILREYWSWSIHRIVCTIQYVSQHAVILRSDMILTALAEDAKTGKLGALYRARNRTGHVLLSSNRLQIWSVSLYTVVVCCMLHAVCWMGKKPLPAINRHFPYPAAHVSVWQAPLVNI